MDKQLNIKYDTQFDNSFNKFRNRKIYKHNWKIMPPFNYIPNKIKFKYEKENDFLIMYLYNKEDIKEVTTDNFIVKYNDKKIVNKIIVKNYTKITNSDIKNIINEINNEYIEINNVLLYDINTRILEFAKKLLIKIKTDKVVEK
jgi:hypothetical protein